MKTLLLSLILLPLMSVAQTNLSGGIYNSETWTPAGSPYIVTGNLVIFDGVHITIEAGTEIRFNTDASIELRGTMESNGQQFNEITFTSNASSPFMGDWDGIKVIGTTNPLGQGDQLTMRWTNFLFASVCVDLDVAYHGPYIFENCRFLYNAVVNNDGGSPLTRFEGCSFEYNEQGLDWCQFDSEAINCDFIGNQIGLIGIDLIDGCYFTDHSIMAMEPYGVTRNCLIENNTLGVKASFNAVNHTFENNTVKNNVVGLEETSFFNGSQTVEGNFFCNNSQYDLKHLSNNNADWSNNCWCNRTDGEIDLKIYDGYDNVSYGLVTYNPQATSCSELTAELNENDFNAEISVFPNPATTEVQIRHNFSDGDVKLFDLTGAELKSLKLSSETKIGLTDLSPGVYLLVLVSSDGIRYEHKLIKQ